MAKVQPVLVPLCDSAASFEALEVAGMMVRRKRMRVRGIHIIEVVRSLPVNAEMEWEARQGEQILRRADDIAREMDFHLDTELLQARHAGTAIVDEAHRQQVSAIVMGMQFRPAIGDFSVGRTTAYVLEHARCPVWVIREAARE